MTAGRIARTSVAYQMAESSLATSGVQALRLCLDQSIDSLGSGLPNDVSCSTWAKPYSLVPQSSSVARSAA